MNQLQTFTIDSFLERVAKAPNNYRKEKLWGGADLKVAQSSDGTASALWEEKPWQSGYLLVETPHAQMFSWLCRQCAQSGITDAYGNKYEFFVALGRFVAAYTGSQEDFIKSVSDYAVCLLSSKSN